MLFLIKIELDLILQENKNLLGIYLLELIMKIILLFALNITKQAIEFLNVILLKMIILWLCKFEFQKKSCVLTPMDPRWLGYQKLKNNFIGIPSIQWHERSEFLKMDAQDLE